MAKIEIASVAPNGRKAKSAAKRVNASSRRAADLGTGCALAYPEHLTDRGRKIIHARARHDDRIPAPVRFLGDAEEFSALVLAKLNVKTLPFNLELFCLDDAIHFQKRMESGRLPAKVEANSAQPGGPQGA